MNKCLVPDCIVTENLVRGLCTRHYYQIRHLINNKIVTEKELVEHKKILPKAKPGLKNRSSNSWFLDFTDKPLVD